jgi:hypothetical protein
MTYLHKHHIIPQSRGGGDEPWNLIELSEYDHAYEHALDFVLFDHAPRFDCRQRGWKMLPKDLQVAVRKKLSETTRKRNKGKVFSNATRKKISVAMKDRTLSEEWRKKLSDSLKGKPKSLEHRQKMGEAQRGKKCSEKELQRLRTINSGRKWFNNGQLSTMSYECPPGFVPGRLKRGPMHSAQNDTSSSVG